MINGNLSQFLDTGWYSEETIYFSGYSMDRLNKRFLEASIFDGKTFWQVENKIAWLEEGSPIIENGRENP